MEKKNLTKKDKIVYALIVLMGVAAFIISTIWLCKTEEAEAATNKYVLINGKQYDYSGVENFESILSSCDELMTRVPDQFIISSNFQYKSAGSPYVQYSGYHINVSGDKVVSVENVNYTYPFSGFYYASFDCTDRGFPSDLTYMAYPTIVSLPTFDKDAPYVVGTNLILKNPYLQQGVLPYGVALKKSYMQLDCNVIGSYSDYDSLTLRGILSVNMPTPEFFKEFCKGLTSTGLTNGTLDFDDLDPTVITSDAVRKYVEGWRGQTKSIVTYHLPFEYEYSVSDIVDGKVTLEFNARQVFDAIELDTGQTLRSIYCPDDITDVQYLVLAETLLSGFLDYFQLGVYTIAKNDDGVCYGRYVSHSFSGTNSDLLSVYVSDLDVENTPSDEFTSDLQNGLGQKSLEHIQNLEQSIKELEAKLEELNNIQASMGGFGGDLSGTDLWTSFSNLANGLMSIGGSISKVSVAAGSALAFLPGDMTSIIMFGLAAIFVVGLVKMIRG